MVKIYVGTSSSGGRIVKARVAIVVLGGSWIWGGGKVVWYP